MDNHELKEKELTVEGMTCASCATTVRTYLEGEGMSEVYVDVPKQKVTFRTVEKEDQLERIMNGIDRLGYKVIRSESRSSWLTIRVKFILTALLTLPLILHHLLHVAGSGIPFLDQPWVQFGLSLPVFVIGIQHFGISAWSALRRGTTNMDVLIILGSTAAFVYSCVGLWLQQPDYYFFETAASIITLVLLGNLMEDRALSSTTTAIDDLEEMEPRSARLWMGEDRVMDIPPEDIRKGDRILVRTGEAFPVDGIVLEGQGDADEALLTGESAPVQKSAQKTVYAGSTLLSGHVIIQATVNPSETVFRQIIRLVKAAQSDRPPIQRLADRISAVFVPVVILIAMAAFFFGQYVFQLTPGQALMNAIAVLVISCPCAMGLATPTAVTVGLGRMTRQGLLIKGATTIELLAGIRTIIFDKTGTLTTGQLKVRQIKSKTGFEAFVRSAIYQMELRSSHPIARALVTYLGNTYIDESHQVDNITEISGVGMTAVDRDGRLLELKRDELDDREGYHLALLRDGEKIGHVALEDELRPEANEVVRKLKEKGFSCWLVSGDRPENAERVGELTGIEQVRGGQLPQDKFALIDHLQQEAPLAMVGDGINDAPALERASVGIAMAGATHTALQSARVALLEPNLKDLLHLFDISKLTVKTIRENLFWAFAYNIVAIPMAFLGFLNPMWGALFMAFSDLVVIGNSIRLKYRS